MKKPNKKSKDLNKLAEKYLNDGNQEAWETGKLGKSLKHAKVVYKDYKKAIPTSMRIPETLLTDLKYLADDTGIPYQTYIKMILTRHVKEKKRRAAA